MVTRVTAEFESPELADIAISRIRQNVKGFCSASTSYSREAVMAERLRHGNVYTILPAAVTSHNYVTGVMEYPASEDIIPEPYRRTGTAVTVICEESAVKNIRSALISSGALSVK